CGEAFAKMEAASGQARAQLTSWLEHYGSMEALLAEVQQLAGELGLGKGGLKGLLGDLDPGRAGVKDQIAAALTGWGLLGGHSSGDPREDIKSMLSDLFAKASIPPNLA